MHPSSDDRRLVRLHHPMTERQGSTQIYCSCWWLVIICTAGQRLSWNAGENCSGVFSRLKASVGKNGVRRTQSRKRTCGHTRRYITRNDTTHKRKRHKRWEEEGVREKTRERGWTQKLRKSRIMSGECLHCPLLICCCCFFQIQTEYLW